MTRALPVTESPLSAIVGAGWICSRPIYSFGRARPASRWVIDWSHAPPATRGGRRAMLPRPGSRAVDIPSDAPTQPIQRSNSQPPPCAVASIRAWWQSSAPAGDLRRVGNSAQPLAADHSRLSRVGDRVIPHPPAGHPHVTRRATVPAPPGICRAFTPGHCRARLRPDVRRGATATRTRWVGIVPS